MRQYIHKYVNAHLIVKSSATICVGGNTFLNKIHRVQDFKELWLCVANKDIQNLKKDTVSQPSLSVYLIE